MQLRLIFILLFLTLSGSVNAQPGWRDFTTRYYYTILDEKGKEIAFKKNKDYVIIVDSMLYRFANIPNDSLQPVTPYETKGFDNYIRINDLSLRIPQKVYHRYYPLEIKIIHKKDTMYLNQITGIGSGIFDVIPLNGKKEVDKAKRTSDFTVQFIAGHYYFPDWAKTVWNDLPLTTGNVKFINYNQRHFIIPKVLYDAIASSYTKYNIRDEVSKKADDWVVHNFIKGYFSLDKRIEPTTFENPALPYKAPYWDDALYPTKDKEVYFGRVRYSKDSLNESNWKYLFSVFNKSKNTIKHWFPKTDPNLFNSGYLYADPYNNIVYQVVWINEKAKQKTYLPPKQCLYQSDDEGETWRENQLLTNLFHKYDFGHIEFLDKNHALSYNRKEIKHKTRNYTVKQTTYYLLKNREVVDSLQTANDYYEFNNYIERYNHYRFSVKDTILLATWNYDHDQSYGKPFSQAVITKVNDQWKFETEQKVYAPRPLLKVQMETDTTDYQNFQLLNKCELIFKNGSGTLRLQNEVVKNPWYHGVVVIEKENRIYLLDNDKGFTYCSFDGGTSWYIYPKPLEERSDYRFLEIDDQNVISFFNPSKLYKAFYKFSPNDN